MKWVLTDKTNLYNFWTLQDDQPVAKLKYGVETQSVRLTYSRHRLFLLEPAGLLQNKILIETGYGLAIGENHFSNKKNHSGNLYVQQLKFHYTTEKDAMVIMNKQQQILANCTIDTINELDDFEFTALLFGFTWYCMDDLQTAKKEHKAEVL